MCVCACVCVCVRACVCVCVYMCVYQCKAFLIVFRSQTKSLIGIRLS